MSLKTFEKKKKKKNGKTLVKNIVKFKLEQNIKFLLHNYLIYICAVETDF